MIDTMELSCTPISENCVQTGVTENHEKWNKVECNVFMRQLIRQFGKEPIGAKLKISRNIHDFGIYYEVAVSYNDENNEATEYAFKLEGNLPENWDEISRQELEKEGYFESLLIKRGV